MIRANPRPSSLAPSEGCGGFGFLPRSADAGMRAMGFPAEELQRANPDEVGLVDFTRLGAIDLGLDFLIPQVRKRLPEIVEFHFSEPGARA